MADHILGSGIDLIECERIRLSIEKFGSRFLQRIFLPGELEYANRQKFPHRHLAARFAAKEAVSKAFGTGIGAQLGWQDMEVCRQASGEPFLQLTGNGLALLQQRAANRVLISLTHTEHYAAATAILIAAL